MTDFNPGPLDGSVLYDQDNHISSEIWNGKVKYAFNKFLMHMKIIAFYILICCERYLLVLHMSLTGATSSPMYSSGP